MALTQSYSYSSQSATGKRAYGSSDGRQLKRMYRLPLASHGRTAGADKAPKTQIKYYNYMSRTLEAQNVKSNTQQPVKSEKKNNGFGIWIVCIIGGFLFFGSLAQQPKTDREIITECAKTCTLEQYVKLKKSIESKEAESEQNSEFMGKILDEAAKPNALESNNNPQMN